MNIVYRIIAGMLIVGLGYAFFLERNENERLHTDLIGQTEKFEQISESVGKLQLLYVDQSTLNAEAEMEFGEEVKLLRGRVKILSNATFLIREKARLEETSDLSYDGKRIKYVFNEIRYENGPPIAYLMIFDDGRVVSKIYNHELACKSVVSRDESTGRYNILNKATFTLKSHSLNTNGEKVWTNLPFDLKITGGSAFIDPTEPSRLSARFFLWAPRFNIGYEANFEGSHGLTAGVSLMGYGSTKRDLDFKFLELGLRLDRDNSFTPRLQILQWRFWRDWFPNTYLGVGMEMGDGGIITPSAGLTLGF